MDERTLQGNGDGSLSPSAADVAVSPRRGRRIPIGAAVLAAAALLILLGLSGWFPSRDDASGEPSLTIGPAYVTPAPARDNSALYFAVTSAGGADDLIGVSSTAVGRATLHRNSGGDGIVAMVETPDLPVPDGGVLTLQPGGSHVMLEGLVEPLVVGGQLEVTLAFERSAPKAVTVQVVTLSQVAELVGTAPESGSTGN